MKTMVIARHEIGPAQNGHDGCHARISGGLCPGWKIAEWLNSLGGDDEPYGNNRKVTNGEVRANWLRNPGTHIVAKDPELARLLDERTQLRRRLADINSRIAQVRKKYERES